MIKQSMRLKVLILPLSLVTAVVVSIFYIQPFFSEVMNARKTLADEQSQLDNLSNQIQKLENLKSKWSSMDDEKSLVASALPETKDDDSYVSELVSKASRSGVLLSNINMDTKDISLTVPSYVCSLVTDGSSGQTVSTTDTGTATDSGNLTGETASPNSCVNEAAISLTAKGSWEQILDFFKYLEDMNRISNVNSLSISTGDLVQNQTASDVLTADISADAFFSKKNIESNTALVTSLASQGDFNQDAIQKLKDTIYAPYETPAVAAGGARNLFK